MRRLASLASVVLITMLIGTLGAEAEPDRAGPKRTRRTLDRWNSQYARAGELYLEGKYKRARIVLEELIAEIVDQVGPGGDIDQVFSRIVLQLALTEAALGQEEDAIWHWHVVLAIEPRYAKSDLSAFGEAGALLARNLPFSESRRLPDQLTVEPGVEITPPKRLRAIPPVFPRGAHAFEIEGQLVVQVIVHEDGSISDPTVLRALPVPTLAWVALESVRDWTFAPARLGEEPIPVWYRVTVNYRLKS